MVAKAKAKAASGRRTVGVVVYFSPEEVAALDVCVAEFQRDRSDGRKVSRAQVLREAWEVFLSDGGEEVIL